MFDFRLAEGAARTSSRDGPQTSSLPTGSLSTLFTSGTEAFDADAPDPGAVAREQPAAIFAQEESSAAPAAFFVAETSFDSEEEGEVNWPAFDEDAG